MRDRAIYRTTKRERETKREKEGGTRAFLKHGLKKMKKG